MVDLSLYLVAGARPDIAEVVTSAIAGGVTLVQLRLKELTDHEIVDIAGPIAGICRDRGIPLIINDRIDLALIVGAQGVHLGVDDLPLEDARKIAPPGFEIGYSPETDDQLQSAGSRGATYLGVGPVYATSTKPDAGEPLGLDEFRRRCSLTSLPVVGIGGITGENAGLVMQYGANGVAVSSAILAASDVEQATRVLRNAVGQ
jgi:thiamine-phosphate pyrophosphorylase